MVIKLAWLGITFNFSFANSSDNQLFQKLLCSIDFLKKFLSSNTILPKACAYELILKAGRIFSSISDISGGQYAHPNLTEERANIFEKVCVTTISFLFFAREIVSQ